MITRDLNERSILTATGGGTWMPLNISRLLKYLNMQASRPTTGNVVGKSSVLPPLIDEATYEAVQNPSNGASSNFRKHLLSGIVICDNCKAPMTGVTPKSQSTRYRWESRSGGCGKVSIKASRVEQWLNNYMDYWVGRSMLNEQPVTESNESAISEIDERIAGIQQAMGAGDMSLEDGVGVLKAARTARNKLVRGDADRIQKRTAQIQRWRLCLLRHDR